MAARIGDIKTVLIPEGNMPDLKKVPKEITKGMRIIPVEHADQVLRLALELEKPEDFLMKKGVGEMPIPAVLASETGQAEAVKH